MTTLVKISTDIGDFTETYSLGHMDEACTQARKTASSAYFIRQWRLKNSEVGLLAVHKTGEHARDHGDYSIHAMKMRQNAA